MKCYKCGNELSKEAKFCGKCGAGILESEAFSHEKKETKVNASITENNKDVIKCGNCGYIGHGELGRRLIFTILAWICVLFAPLITILYFVFTNKYVCPRCHSNFIAVKDKQGVFMEPKRSSPIITILIIFVAIAAIGILSSVVVVSLNTARAKARDAKRVADIQEVKTALNSYYYSNSIYPDSLNKLVPVYVTSLPVAPSEGESYLYISSIDGSEYHLGAYLEQVLPDTGILSDDADCNSVEGVCFTKEFSLGFDGKDPIYDLTNYSN